MPKKLNRIFQILTTWMFQNILLKKVNITFYFRNSMWYPKKFYKHHENRCKTFQVPWRRVEVEIYIFSFSTVSRCSGLSINTEPFSETYIELLRSNFLEICLGYIVKKFMSEIYLLILLDWYYRFILCKYCKSGLS